MSAAICSNSSTRRTSSAIEVHFLECIAEPGREVHAEVRVQHRDGGWRWLDGSAVNQLDDPAVQAVVLNYRDVTERKHAEQHIQFQANVLAQVTDAILVLDLQERITYWNKGAERLYGFRCSRGDGAAVAGGDPLSLAQA